MTLADNHVQVMGKDAKAAMTNYIDQYIAQIKANRKMAKLFCQMGWKDDGQFILGRHIVNPDGTITAASLARNVPRSVEAFHTCGEIAPWVNATRVFRAPGMEAHAFAFLAGAFGAPLMKFTGYAGAMVAMLGPSGAGKTLIGRWALSTYGDPDKLIMLKDDTKNALIGRLGAYGTLPLYIDEVTNIDGKELSELVYRVTQGRDKARQGRDAVEKKVLNHWTTLALVSSNSSLVDRLSTEKLNANAELCRVIEFIVPHNEFLDRTTATEIYRTINDNYGHIGLEYVKYLAAHADQHQAKIDIIAKKLDSNTKATNEERFWSAAIAATVYGGMIAKKLGLIDFEVGHVMAWAEETIIKMRATKDDVVCDGASMLGRFLDQHVQNRLTISGKNSIKHEPKGALNHRVEPDTNMLFISRSYLREWVTKGNGSYTTMKNELEAKGALIATDRRKSLGAGTNYAGPVQPCWVLNIKHPALGMVVASLAEDLKVENMEGVI